MTSKMAQAGSTQLPHDFQTLENPAGIFPMFGKPHSKFSNVWKTSLSLLAAVLAGAASARAGIIFGVDPNHGAEAGGYQVDISGDALCMGTVFGVTLAGAPASSIDFASPGAIRVTAGAGSGSGAVVVDSDLGTSSGGSFTYDATAVKLADFSRRAVNGQATVCWETAAEHETVGFNVYRRDDAAGQWIKLNAQLVPARGWPQGGVGAAYSLPDRGATITSDYKYKVEEIETSGRLREYGPFDVRASAAPAQYTTVHFYEKFWEGEGFIDFTVYNTIQGNPLLGFCIAIQNTAEPWELTYNMAEHHWSGHRVSPEMWNQRMIDQDTGDSYGLTWAQFFKSPTFPFPAGNHAAIFFLPYNMRTDTFGVVWHDFENPNNAIQPGQRKGGQGSDERFWVINIHGPHSAYQCVSGVATQAFTTNATFTVEVGAVEYNLTNAPRNVFASQTDPGQVQVAWDALAGAEGYEVWRHTNDDSAVATVLAGGITNLLYDDTTAARNQDYTYWVKGSNYAGYSEFSLPATGFVWFCAITCMPDTLYFTMDQGGPLPNVQTAMVANVGKGSFEYFILSEPIWAGIAPSGTNDLPVGSQVATTVTFNTNALTLVSGVYTTWHSVASDLACGSLTSLRLVTTVNPPLPTNIHYVRLDSPNPTPPYLSWATAATQVQDAVHAARDGDVVLVTNGVYATGSANATDEDEHHLVSLPGRMLLTNDVVVRSVNGPAVTTLVGEGPSGTGAVRCAYLRAGRLDGFTLTNGHVRVQQGSITSRDGLGGGAYIEDGATVSNCVISGCDGSGVYLEVGQLGHCVVRGNRGVLGGGICALGDTTIDRCQILDNTASDVGGEHGVGGGAYLEPGLDVNDAPRMYNCFIAGNFAASQRNGGGGGVCLDAGTVRNCTVVNNRCSEYGGGLFVGSSVAATNRVVINSIIYNNRAPYGADVFNEEGGAPAVMHHNCAGAALAGAGNLTNAPLVAGIYNPHIVTASPCRGAGDPSGIAAAERDIDGEARLGAGASVDMGCDQYHPGAITGAIQAGAAARYTQVVAGAPFELLSDVQGKTESFEWSYDLGGGWQVFTNAWQVRPVFANAGQFPVVVWAGNEAQFSVVTVMVTVVAGFTNYVSPRGAHVAPFTNWAQAATNIQAAIDECYVGGVTLVDTGRYRLGATILVAKPMTLRGAGSRYASVVDGQNQVGCLFIDDSAAVVEALDLVGGNAIQGGGALVYDGVLRGCAIENCVASRFGGGARVFGSARIEDCLVLNNIVQQFGGGLFADDRAEIRRCQVMGNTSRNGGGGVWLDQDAVMIDSAILANRGYGGGGVTFYTGGTMRNCTIYRNFADGYGGGVWHGDGTTRNCIIYGNVAPAGADNYKLNGDVAINYCLTTPGVIGTGNITNADPRLAGLTNPHILLSSPCRNAGDASGIAFGEQDIDDEARLFEGAVDIGCDEIIPTNLLPACLVAIVGDSSTVVNDPASLQSHVYYGKPGALAWRVDQGGGVTNLFADQTSIEPVWSAPGRYVVTLCASNLGGVACATTEVWVVEEGFATHVATNGTHVYPYTNWVTAATNVAAAVAACPEGGTTWIGAGTWPLNRQVGIARRMTLAGAAAREQVVLDSGELCRVLMVNHAQALVHTLTLANGFDYYGAGLELLAGTASNIVVANCYATNMYGGVNMGGSSVLRDSLVVSNRAPTAAGIRAAANAQVINCQVWFNEADGQAAGIQLENNARAAGCDVRGNLVHLGPGGGLYLDQGGVAEACMVHSNAASTGVGAFLNRGGVVSNCTFELGWAFFYGAGVWFSGGGLVTDCRIANNLAEGFDKRGGGVIMNRGGQLRRSVVCSNRATRAAGVYIQVAGDVTDCDIYGNRATTFEHEGLVKTGSVAGVMVYGEGTVANSRIHHNVSAGHAGGAWIEAGGALRNCLVYGNQADGLAGGVTVVMNEDTETAGTIANCTVVDNTAGNAAGGVYFESGGEAVNSIVQDNTAPTNAQYALDDGGVMKFSCTTPDNPAFTAMTTADPQFAGGATNNYRLTGASPCVNTGTNEDWMAGATDFAGNSRVIGPRVDMGAYEYLLAPTGLVAQVNGTGCVQLDWSAVAGSGGYAVFRSATTNVPAEALAVVSGNTYCDGTAQPGQHYYYWVNAHYLTEGSAVSAAAVGWLRNAGLPWLMLLLE